MRFHKFQIIYIAISSLVIKFMFWKIFCMPWEDNMPWKETYFRSLNFCCSLLIIFAWSWRHSSVDSQNYYLAIWFERQVWFGDTVQISVVWESSELCLQNHANIINSSFVIFNGKKVKIISNHTVVLMLIIVFDELNWDVLYFLNSLVSRDNMLSIKLIIDKIITMCWPISKS